MASQTIPSARAVRELSFRQFRYQTPTPTHDGKTDVSVPKRLKPLQTGRRTVEGQPTGLRRTKGTILAH